MLSTPAGSTVPRPSCAFCDLELSLDLGAWVAEDGTNICRYVGGVSKAHRPGITAATVYMTELERAAAADSGREELTEYRVTYFGAHGATYGSKAEAEDYVAGGIKHGGDPSGYRIEHRRVSKGAWAITTPARAQHPFLAADAELRAARAAR